MCEVKALAVVYQAVRVIAVYLLFCSLLLGILPDSVFKQYVRLFAGLLLLLLLLHSLSAVFSDLSVDFEEVLEKSAHAVDFEERLLESEKVGEEKIKEEILQQTQ